MGSTRGQGWALVPVVPGRTPHPSDYTRPFANHARRAPCSLAFTRLHLPPLYISTCRASCCDAYLPLPSLTFVPPEPSGRLRVAGLSTGHSRQCEAGALCRREVCDCESVRPPFICAIASPGWHPNARLSRHELGTCLSLCARRLETTRRYWHAARGPTY